MKRHQGHDAAGLLEAIQERFVQRLHGRQGRGIPHALIRSHSRCLLLRSLVHVKRQPHHHGAHHRQRLRPMSHDRHGAQSGSRDCSAMPGKPQNAGINTTSQWPFRTRQYQKNCSTTFIFKALSPCLTFPLFLLDHSSRVLLWYLKAMRVYGVAARTLTEYSRILR